MGQQNSLNCKNNSKDEGKEIETNHTNALHLMRTLNEKETPSDLKSKTSPTNRSQISQGNPLINSRAQKRPNQQPPQHGNILRVSSSQFRGAEKVAGKWVQRVGKSLAQIIEGRYNTNMHFPQSQVVTLIESLVYALAYLEKNSLRHHDFYPTNVYYQSGVFKITNPVSHETSAYTLTQQRQRFSFLSPELIAQLIEQTTESDIPARIMYKGDLFAIGMIVLQFCTLEQSCECYDEENYSLVDKIIQSRLAKTAKVYSNGIAQCIREMLKYDVEERITPIQLALAVFMHAPQEKQQPEERARPEAGPRQPKQVAQAPQNVQYLQVPGVMPGPQPIPDNSVALPAPNYVYSHIGPNNQSLLSGSALQNKLRLIEKIQEKPQQEEDSQGQPSSMTFPSHPSAISEKAQPGSRLSDNPHPHLQARTREMPPHRQPPPSQQQPREQQAQPRPQVPMPRIEQRYPESEVLNRTGNVQIQSVPGHPPFVLPPEYHAQQLRPPVNFPPPMPVQHAVQGHQMVADVQKPGSPPLAVRNNFVAPSSDKQSYASGSIKVESFKQEGPKLQDRILLSQPTHYQIQAKGGMVPSNIHPNQAEGSRPGEFVPKILEEGNYQFSFKEKFGRPTNDLPEYKPTKQTSNDFSLEYQKTEAYERNTPQQYNLPSYKPKYDFNSAVPGYQSSTTQLNYSYPTSKQSFDNYPSRTETFSKRTETYQITKDTEPTSKYSRTEEYSGKGIGKQPVYGKYARPKDEGGETLEQRVDRILQISRSIK